MIKECKVVLDNGLNMVVLFDNKEVQMPSTKTKCSTVYVEKINGVYSLSSKSEFEKSIKPKKKEQTENKEVLEDVLSGFDISEK